MGEDQVVLDEQRRFESKVVKRMSVGEVERANRMNSAAAQPGVAQSYSTGKLFGG